MTGTVVALVYLYPEYQYLKVPGEEESSTWYLVPLVENTCVNSPAILPTFMDSFRDYPGSIQILPKKPSVEAISIFYARRGKPVRLVYLGENNPK